jgi:hypothetical protein
VLPAVVGWAVVLTEIVEVSDGVSLRIRRVIHRFAVRVREQEIQSPRELLLELYLKGIVVSVSIVVVPGDRSAVLRIRLTI